MKPYKGSEPYIFISYSHKDYDRIESVLQHLSENRYRVWYDEGIDPGTEWDDNIAQHVLGCHFFVAMISENYLLSENCKDELNFARENNKNRILIYLEDVELPAGMAMRLNRIQSIYKNRYADQDEFYEKLYSAPGIRSCRDENDGAKRAENPAAPQAQKTSVPRAEKPVAPRAEKPSGTANRPITYKSGSYYVGPVENGRPEGNGTMYYPDGRIKYTGPFRDGKYDGPGGILYFENGERYEGDWKNGNKEGTGTYFFKDGSWFEGSWKDGTREGKGVLYYPDGKKKYEGPYVSGKRHGEMGIYYFKDGSRYEGPWKNNYREGFGKLINPDGSLKYEGPFANGKKNGEKGIYYYSDGSRYEGPWKDDLRNGEGVLYHPDGSIKYKGLFTEGSYGKQK